MKRHARTLLYLLPLAVALSSLFVCEARDTVPWVPMHHIQMVPR
jgi:hypothetical protein